ncbi:hypothetical protein Q9233_011504 [Columba guinea]|nr:hypothetical protein Q9233_011504 [Columba guinea]
MRDNPQMLMVFAAETSFSPLTDQSSKPPSAQDPSPVLNSGCCKAQKCLGPTYNGQNESNEDYEIPPITPPNLPDPSLLHLVDHEAGFHSLCHSLPPNSLIPAYPYQNMDLPAIMVSNMLSQDGHLLSSQLPTIQEMVHSDAASYESNRQVPLLNRPGMLAGPMSALSQSQLISQMGIRSGVTHGSPSPPGSKSATPSPSSSTQEEETESHYKVTGEKRPSTDLGKKPKSQKKKKKKDPNEPQKPVSAYALFFRDTQAAIKGQNPNATFGDVSKIVASMWDSLGEEQKQDFSHISSEFQNSVGPRSPGASNPAGSTEWDSDYPSRECGINHCRPHAAKGQGTLPHLKPTISFRGGSDKGHLRGSISQTTRGGTEQVVRTRELPLHLVAGFVSRL